MINDKSTFKDKYCQTPMSDEELNKFGDQQNTKIKKDKS